MGENILIQVDTFIHDKVTADLTIECIRKARLLELPILLTSHLEIPEEIQKLADFVEIDLANPRLENDGSVSTLNTFSEKFEIRLILNNPDPHAPACLTSIINGARFAERNGFDFFLRIEYDAILKTTSIEKLKHLIKAACSTNGLFFSNFGEWVDGKFILCNAKLYLKSFNVEIKTGKDYLDFISNYNIDSKNFRHLQIVQYNILRKNRVLQNMIIAPSSLLESILDRDSLKKREKEVGLFRPVKVVNGGGEKFATVAHGFARTLPFTFEIYMNGSLVKKEEQYFIGGSVTHKIYHISPETLYKVVYINPVTFKREEWEFSSSDQLYSVGNLTFK